MRNHIRMTKRAMDILFSVVGLLLTLPFFPLLALLIRLDSKGPIFYTQERVNGLVDLPDGSVVFKTFHMIKFRTMVKNAEAKTGAIVAQQNDARVTRVGKILRRTRLDELPQFINVLVGDMSLVGPRPERPEMLSNLSAIIPFFEERVRDIKPGITGLAQVNLNYTGRMNETHPLYTHKEALTNPYELPETIDSLADDMRTKVLFDHAYSAFRENLWMFLKFEFLIIFRTVYVMISGKGR